jgi:hypothetical protein
VKSAIPAVHAPVPPYKPTCHNTEHKLTYTFQKT